MKRLDLSPDDLAALGTPHPTAGAGPIRWSLPDTPAGPVYGNSYTARATDEEGR